MTFSRFIQTQQAPPSSPSAVRLPPMFSIIEPLERTNMMWNPSFETDELDTIVYWSSSGSGLLNYSTADSFKGAACLTYEATTTTNLLIGGTGAAVLPLVSGSVYVLSFYAKLAPTAPGKRGRFQYGFGTTGSAYLVSRTDALTSRWQRFWIAYKETASNNRQIQLQLIDLVDIYVDAFQVELCESGNIYPTTYIDGDQQGLLIRQTPPPYFWTGTPHGSPSVRLASTNAGGRVIRLDKFGFELYGVSGLGLQTPDLQTVQYAEIDGGSLHRIHKGERQFTLIGQIGGETGRQTRSRIAGLASLFDRDKSLIDQPLKLLFSPMNDLDQIIGDECELVATYEGGLEGEYTNPSSETITINLIMHDPTIVTTREFGIGIEAVFGGTLGSGFIASRSRNGTWDDLATGVAGGGVKAILRHPNGLVFVGGAFTSAGATSADFCAIYNPVTDTWSNVNGSDTTFNSNVNALEIDAVGNVYIGGNFTNAAGIANADGICRVSPTGGSLAALGTGVSAGGSVRALTRVQHRIIAGGNWATMGGVASVDVASWDTVALAWSTMAGGVSAGTDVLALAGFGSKCWAGGDFTLMGVPGSIRIAMWDFNDPGWEPLGTSGTPGANNVVRALLVDSLNGDLYVGGDFSTLDGLDIQCFGKWNGYSFSSPIGNVFDTTFPNQVRSLAFDSARNLWIGGLVDNALVSSTGLIHLDVLSGFIVMSGSALVYPMIDATSTIGGDAIEVARDNTIYIGWASDVTMRQPTRSTITYTGTARTFPTFRFECLTSTSGVGAFHALGNATTGFSVYFSPGILQVGEKWEIRFDPRRVSYISDLLGSVAANVMAGSHPGQFYLAPGTNIIESIGNLSGSATGMIFWKNAHATLDAIWPSPLRGL